MCGPCGRNFRNGASENLWAPHISQEGSYFLGFAWVSPKNTVPPFYSYPHPLLIRPEIELLVCASLTSVVLRSFLHTKTFITHFSTLVFILATPNVLFGRKSLNAQTFEANMIYSRGVKFIFIGATSASWLPSKGQM